MNQNIKIPVGENVGGVIVSVGANVDGVDVVAVGANVGGVGVVPAVVGANVPPGRVINGK